MRFDELELEDEILDGLYDMNFQEMTPVQEHTIPVILEGRDIIGCAQTGTGKTAAYTLPLLNRLLLEGNEDNVIKSVIIVPTRELAQQIDQQFQGFFLLPAHLDHGRLRRRRRQGLGRAEAGHADGVGRGHRHSRPHDFAYPEQRYRPLACRMPDSRRSRPHARHGFQRGHHEDCLVHARGERQTIMFSATLPPKIRELAKTILRNPAEVNIAISKPNEAIDQSAYVCYENQKLGIIREMFAEPTESKTIIFSSSKMKVKGAGAYAQTHETQRGGHALRSGAGPARGGDARLQEQQGLDPRGHRHRGARHRHRRHRTGHQLRRAARPRRLYPPHRPYGVPRRPVLP